MRGKMNALQKGYVLPELSVKMKTMVTVFAIVMGILLPQVCHVAGRAVGVNSGLGEMLLPMHLPVLLVGFLAGPVAGGITGVLTPLISFQLTAMPGVVMLPFITIELAVYGAASGLLKNWKVASFWKVLLAQVSGRVIRGLAICLSVYALGNGKIAVSVIFTSISVGIVGIILQWIVIPLVLRFVGKEDCNAS